MRISDWSSDVCSSDLRRLAGRRLARTLPRLQHWPGTGVAALPCAGASVRAGLIHARLRSATRTRLPLLQQLHFDRTVARPLRGSALAVAPAVSPREIYRRAPPRHSPSVAMPATRPGNVGIDLGGRRDTTPADAP